MATSPNTLSQVDRPAPNAAIGSYITISCAGFFSILFLVVYHKRFWNAFRDWKIARCYLLSMFVMIVCGAIYMLGSAGTDSHYLQWAFARKDHILNDRLGGRLPDRLLDLIPMVDDTYIVPIYDSFPTVLAIVAAIMGCIMVYPAEFNHLVFCVGPMLLFNSIVENVTMMPASLGWKICKQRYYSNINSVSDLTLSNMNPMGGCASMMWSGHCWHTAVGIWIILSIAEKEWEAVARITKKRFLGITVKMYIAWGMSLFVAVLLVLGHGHYSVDIVIALIVGTLVLSNDYWQHACTKLNPLLKHIPHTKCFYTQALENEKVIQALTIHHPHILKALEEDIMNNINIVTRYDFPR